MNQTRKLTDQQKIDIVYEYTIKKLSTVKLAKKYNVTFPSIRSILILRGVKMRGRKTRKYRVNEDFFNKIDTEEKAYFLGFLYADGTVRRPGTGYSFSINLQEEDGYMLENFKRMISYEGPLSFVPINKKIKTRKNQYNLQICSKRLYENLQYLGCGPKKSLILRFPNEKQVPNHLINHFIRGYFDGDGCIYFSKKGYTSVTIISSNIFCNELKDMVFSRIGVLSTVRQASRCTKFTKIFSISDKNNITKFLDWIYKDATIFLKRKYDKYIYRKSNLSI